MTWWNTLRDGMTGASPRRARRLGAHEVERLLRGGSVAADRRALKALLAHAAAPPTADEQAGLQAAVDAFVRARQQWPRAGSPVAPVGGAARRAGAAQGGSVRPGAKTGRWTATVSAAATAIVAAGVIVASGSLPAPIQHSVHGLLSAVGLAAPGETPTAGAPASASRFGRSAPHPSQSRTPASTPGSAGAAPPVVVSLCQTYLSGKKHGKGMAAADLDQLAEAAGGKNNIEAFCTGVLSRQVPTATPLPATTGPGKGQQHGHGRQSHMSAQQHKGVSNLEGALRSSSPRRPHGCGRSVTCHQPPSVG